jgi:hypothetical protein
MSTLPFYYIPRWSPKHKEAVLFLPDMPANKYNIVCYAHVGQHSEACMEYYRETRRPRPNKKERQAINALIREYSGLMDKSEHMELKRKDSRRFQKVRWGIV